MILNQSSETAVTVLVHLAKQGTGSPVSARHLGEILGGSETYLAKTIHDLVRGGLLRSYRGAQGGVVLDRPAAAITLREIVEISQGVIGASYCRPVTDGEPICAYHQAMVEVRRAIVDVLSSWTLEDLAAPGPPNPECKLRALFSTSAASGSATPER